MSFRLRAEAAWRCRLHSWARSVWGKVRVDRPRGPALGRWAATPLFGESACFPRPDTENSPEQMNRFCRKATWYFMLFPVARVCPLLGVVGLPRTCRPQAFVRHTSCQATVACMGWGAGPRAATASGLCPPPAQVLLLRDPDRVSRPGRAHRPVEAIDCIFRVKLP